MGAIISFLAVTYICITCLLFICVNILCYIVTGYNYENKYNFELVSRLLPLSIILCLTWPIHVPILIIYPLITGNTIY